PAPTSAPVIVFLHGWSAMQPQAYDRWIEHLVRRGNIVIYPRYQQDLLTPPRDFTPNTLTVVHAALRELHVQPELEHIAVVGHSMGGAITANIAADTSLVVRAAMCVEPGDGTTRN